MVHGIRTQDLDGPMKKSRELQRSQQISPTSYSARRKCVYSWTSTLFFCDLRCFSNREIGATPFASLPFVWDLSFWLFCVVAFRLVDIHVEFYGSSDPP